MKTDYVFLVISKYHNTEDQLFAGLGNVELMLLSCPQRIYRVGGTHF